MKNLKSKKAQGVSILLILLLFNSTLDAQTDTAYNIQNMMRITSFSKDFWTPKYDDNDRTGSNGNTCTSSGGACRGYWCAGSGSNLLVGLKSLCGANDAPVSVCDPYGNLVKKIGKYGTDSRQIYYVYLPKEYDVNTPIVVLIHGGAWLAGPSSLIKGFGTKLAWKTESTNLVKELLDNGFAVVSVLYRLAKYGNTDAEMAANDITWQTQINDIDAAILSVRNNFPTCLGINANSIQVYGESAGAHLAMMWAYTKTTAASTYIKSVVPCYGPTNMQKIGDFMKSKPCGTYFCGISNYTDLSKGYYPYYLPANLNNTYNTYASVNPLNCGISGSDVLALIAGCVASSGTDPDFCNTNYKIIDSWRMIQSALAVSTPITAPLTNSSLLAYSPFNALANSTVVIPTFILHGENDVLVPYNGNNSFSSEMETNLSSASHGGLIRKITSSSNATDQIVPTTYSSSNPRNLIKTYDNCNHGFASTTNPDTNPAPQIALYAQVRLDLLSWLNGHK